MFRHLFSIVSSVLIVKLVVGAFSVIVKTLRRFVESTRLHCPILRCLSAGRINHAARCRAYLKLAPDKNTQHWLTGRSLHTINQTQLSKNVQFCWQLICRTQIRPPCLSNLLALLCLCRLFIAWDRVTIGTRDSEGKIRVKKEVEALNQSRPNRIR